MIWLHLTSSLLHFDQNIILAFPSLEILELFTISTAQVLKKVTTIRNILKNLNFSLLSLLG